MPDHPFSPGDHVVAYLRDSDYENQEFSVKRQEGSIREKFNTYRFADYKESVIELLGKVCRVSAETMRIIGEMPE